MQCTVVKHTSDGHCKGGNVSSDLSDLGDVGRVLPEMHSVYIKVRWRWNNGLCELVQDLGLATFSSEG